MDTAEISQLEAKLDDLAGFMERAIRDSLRPIWRENRKRIEYHTQEVERYFAIPRPFRWFVPTPEEPELLSAGPDEVCGQDWYRQTRAEIKAFYSQLELAKSTNLDVYGNEKVWVILNEHDSRFTLTRKEAMVQTPFMVLMPDKYDFDSFGGWGKFDDEVYVRCAKTNTVVQRKGLQWRWDAGRGIVYWQELDKPEGLPFDIRPSKPKERDYAVCG